MVIKQLNYTFYLYNQCVSYLLQQLRSGKVSDEDALRGISQIARFAWECSPGVYSDYRLEKAIKRIADNVLSSDDFSLPTKNKSAGNRKKVLHLVSKVYGVGGHTRILRNWIQEDDQSHHALILTSQAELEKDILPADLSISLIDQKKSFVERSKEIRRKIIEYNPDIIILHIHPDDVESLVGITGIKLPVIYYNHADHVFWLGVSFSTIIADFIKGHKKSTEKHRQGKSFYLPYILEEKLQKAKLEKRDDFPSIRKSFDRVLVSMGSNFKYRPVVGFDFMSTYEGLMKEFPDAVLYIIGYSEEDYYHFYGKAPQYENIQLLGKLPDPVDYLKNADLFIEPFPLGSGLGTVEAIALGAVPVFNYGEMPNINQGTSSIFKEDTVYFRAETHAEYMNYVRCLLRDERKLQNVREAYGKLSRQFFPPEWNKYLHSLYEYSLNEGNEKLGLSEKLKCDLSAKQIRINKYAVKDIHKVTHKFLKNYTGPLNFNIVFKIITMELVGNQKSNFQLIRVALKRWLLKK